MVKFNFSSFIKNDNVVKNYGVCAQTIY